MPTHQKKKLLEGYVGVKFRCCCEGASMPAPCRDLYPLFRQCGDRLREHGMTPANGGNLSQRQGSAMVITTSGCNLGTVEEDELALVSACSLERQSVSYAGPNKPSSEAMLHWLIYRDFPGAGAVVHAHDELATAQDLARDLPETPREEPYGTVALARLAAEAFHRGSDIIVLRNHGYVASGPDLCQTVETVVQMHLKLMALR